MVLFLINKRISIDLFFPLIYHRELVHVLKIYYNEYDSMVLLLILHNNMNQLKLMESYKNSFNFLNKKNIIFILTH